MFGNFPSLVSLPAKVKIDPKDIPPPTPINLPRYQPFAQDDASANPAEALSELLKHTGRGTSALGVTGLAAIGLDLKLDASVSDLVPDASYVPDFRQWDSLSPEEARDLNQSTRRPLRNGNLSPGCQVYLERKKEIANLNEDGFRTVRRIPPPKGKQQARLGNAYEFFRCLELFTTFWDDPTAPPDLPLSPELLPSEAAATATEESKPDANDEPASAVRVAAGSTMPPEYRNNAVSAFIKLVGYDFGCNVSPARLEPRLQLTSPPDGSTSQRRTYTPSGCTFIYQSPLTREAARAGMVYGPVAAVSARAVVDFSAPDVETAQSLDLAREVVAALITAQHRAREGRTETRFGAGQWWTTEKRWGGGSGGPIGREIEKDAVAGDKDARANDADGMPLPPVAKKARKTMSIYDNYRMVRQPSSTWDKKTSYEAIGRQKGSNYDDIFLVSSLFHHISVLRVRVPLRLLEVLDGAPEPDAAARSWGRVQAWRSPWYDLFDAHQRLPAMQLIWAVVAYQMRRDTGGGDVDMTDA